MSANQNYSSWYQAHYPELTQAGLWLRGGELNTLPPSAWDERETRALFVRLSTYENTGYSFTHQFLYQLAADMSGIFPDLAYLPPARDGERMTAAGVPWLIGTQIKRGARAFDLIGFSNSIVQELINLPHFLERSGIPLRKSERLQTDGLPLLLLGGANALYTSALWVSDPLIDGVFVGESELAIRRILELCREAKLAGWSKPVLLERLEEVDGFFQPDRLRPTQKAFVSNLNTSTALEHGPVYFLADQLGSAHLQISEGCPCFCSFCAESWDRKPYRERRAAALQSLARRMKAKMGLDSIELYSFNFNMHSDFYRIIWDLVPEFQAVGLKSQRFDLLAHDPRMLEFQHIIEKTSLTCGLEGISPRLRAYLHKNLETEELHGSLAAIFASGARGLKVFLVATGLEEEQDFAAFADLVQHMHSVRSAYGATTRVVFSITPLVRFPWTPLEFEPAPPAEHYEPILERVASVVRASGFEFREAAELDEYWVSQVLIRAADPRIHSALLEAVSKSGFVFQRAVTPEFRRQFAASLRERGLAEEALLAGYTLDESRGKPWAMISTGVHREFLWEEVLRARRYHEIDYCLGRAWTKAKCFQCGGCPTPQHIKDIVKAKQDQSIELSAFAARVRQAREGEFGVSFMVDVGEAGVGVPRKAVGVALARALMLAEPLLVPHYRGYVTSFWSAKAEDACWLAGVDRLELLFTRAAVPLLQAVDCELVDRELQGWGHYLGLAEQGWQSGPLEWLSPYRARLDAWLSERTLGATLTRAADGSANYLFGPKAKKRDVLRSLQVWSEPDTTRVRLQPGRRFDLLEFVRQAFILPRKSDWVRIRGRAQNMTSVLVR